MTQNVGKTESYIRIGLGAVAAVAALSLVRSRLGKSLLGLAAFSGLQSGLTRHCAVKDLLARNNTTEPDKAPSKNSRLSKPSKSLKNSSDSAAFQVQNRAM